MSRKKIIIILTSLGGILVLGAIGALLFTSRGMPQVVATTLSGKVSSNADFTVTFNHFMRPGSVRAAFSISPEVKGKLQWRGAAFRFVPEDQFVLHAQTYILTIKAGTRDVLGRRTRADYTAEFMVVEPPKVILMTPQGVTDPESKITVMFDRPMVQLTNLDEAEKHLPELSIIPKVDGTFRWVGASAVQFVPKARLAYSTKYTVVIPQGTRAADGGTTVEQQQFTFETPRVALLGVGHPRYPEEALWLEFNQAVDRDSVARHVRLFIKDGPELALNFSYGTKKEYEEKDGKQVERTVENKKVVDIRPKTGRFLYAQGYWLELDSGIEGEEGNLAADSQRREEFWIASFMESAGPQCTGACVSPTPKISFRFHEDVDLKSVRSAFAIEPEIAVKVEYGKRCDPKWDPQEEGAPKECPLIDDESLALLKAEQVLPNNASYHVALRVQQVQTKQGNRAQEKEQTYGWNFTVAGLPEIVSHSVRDASYREFCLYSNNHLDEEQLKAALQFSPEYTKKEKAGSRDIYVSSYPPRRAPHDYRGSCDVSQYDSRWAARVNVLFNPETDYTVTVPGTAPDEFGQRLGKDYILRYRTAPLKDEDTLLSRRQPESFAVATATMKIPIVFETKNLTALTFKLCRLAPEKYIQIDTEATRMKNATRLDTGWNGFTPSASLCEFYSQWDQAIPQRYFEPTFTQLDIHKRLGADFVPGLYYLEATSPHVYQELRPSYYSEVEKRYVRGEIRRVYTRPFIMVSYTDTQLVTKRAQDQLLVWATGLKDGQPKSGVELAFYNGRGERVLQAPAVTGADGIFRQAVDKLSLEYTVGKRGSDVALLRQGWDEGIAAWDFGLGSETLRDGVVGYLYTDRPLYRPGHAVYFKGILREEYDASFKIPLNKQVRVTINSQDNEVYRKEVPVSPSGTFSGEFTLAGSAPLGYYNIQAEDTCGTPNPNCKTIQAYGNFEVEEFRKPEYKTEIKFDQESYINRETLRAEVQGSYYFGAPVRGGTINWSITSQNYYFDEYKEDWFSFSDSDYSYDCYGQCPYEDNVVSQGETKLDELGGTVIVQPLALHKNRDGKDVAPKTSKIYTLNLTLTDANNQSVYAGESVVVHRGDLYVGVRSEEYVATAGQPATFTVIAVDPKGKAISGKALEAELIEVQWKSMKKENVDGTFYWENEQKELVVAHQEVRSGGNGKASVTFTVPKGGQYRIRAKAKDSRGNEIVSSAGFWVSSPAFINWRRENHNRMEITTDKTEYRVGETATVLVRSPYSGVKALLTVERGSIMEAKVIAVASNAQVLSIPITEAMIPNAFVSVLEVRQELPDEAPDFKIGYVNLLVNTEPRNLYITIATDKDRYRPNEPLRIVVTTENLKREPVRANLSLAVVDESLLALKGNPKKDPVSAFYNRHGVGVQTNSSLTKILERANLKTAEGSKGGGGGGDAAFHYRGEFKDTAHWVAEVTTGTDGKAMVDFTLPENLTTWVIEAVGVTDHSLIGVAERSVTSGKDVILRPVLPRFVRATDAVHVGAIVHNFTGSRQTFEVSVETENLTVAEKLTQRVTLESDASTKVTWEGALPLSTVGKQAVVRLKAVAGSFSDGVEIRLPILSYSSPESVATSGVTEDQSFTESVVLSDAVDRTQGSLTIDTAPTLTNFIPSSLEYLFQFPYSSNEGTISTMIPLMTLKSALRIPNLEQVITIPEIKGPEGKKYALEELVSISLQRLYRAQRADGGWGYWEESRESNAYLTAYLLYGLQTIKKAGYPVDEKVMTRAVQFVSSYMKSNRDLEGGQKKTQWWADNRAYFLYVLSEMGRGDLGLALNLWEDEALLGTFGRIHLLMALANHQTELEQGNKTAERLGKHINRLTQDLEARARIDARGSYIEPTDYHYRFLLTRAKTTALTIQALARTNINHPLLPRLITWLARSRVGGHWASTNETAASLVAFVEYLERSRETEARYRATISLAGKIIAEYDVSAETIFKTQTVEIPVATLGDSASQPVVFRKNGAGKLYYEMLLKYYLPVLKLEPRSQGITLSREYFQLDDKKMERPVQEAKAGETLQGKLTIVLGEERHFVTAEVPLPAGFELVNFELATADQSLRELEGFEKVKGSQKNGYYPSCYCGGAYWEHKELRDDRLFLFAESLAPGVYEYTYLVQATTPGIYSHPPASVFETYFPENFGRTRGELFRVSE